jgi:hypothetical protein
VGECESAVWVKRKDTALVQLEGDYVTKHRSRHGRLGQRPLHIPALDTAALVGGRGVLSGSARVLQHAT